MGTQKYRLNETDLLSTQNICLRSWLRKYLQFSAENVCFSKPVIIWIGKSIRIQRVNTGHHFLAHRIGISEILPWDRKSYLTHAISPRMSSNVMWNCILHIQGLLEAYFEINKLKQWWARKRTHYSCEGRIEKSVPWDHLLSSLGKPRDAKRRSSG